MDQTDIQALFDHIKHVDDAMVLPQFPCEAEFDPDGHADGSFCFLPDRHAGLHCAAIVGEGGEWAYALVWK